jgi:hypothetical protein
MNTFHDSAELKEWCINATPLQLQIRIEQYQSSVKDTTHVRPQIGKIYQDALDIFKHCLTNYPVTAENYPNFS